MQGSFEKKIVNNNGIEIEYYVSNKANDNSTLIISMGIWEPGTRAFSLISRLSGRHCIVLSYRGRGGSSTPNSGFDCTDHMTDLACVLQNESTYSKV
jgi:predicted alpha/beta hydrolase